MSELWMFITTIIVGAIWLAVGGYVIMGVEYTVDHAGGWLMGMAPDEVNEMREWRERS